MRRSAALFLLAGSLLAFPSWGRSQEGEELLLPGQSLDRSMAAGEKHAYRVEVTDYPLLFTVDQQSIDLVLEVRGPANEELRTGLGGARWGPEVLLLESAGERRIEVHPKEKSIWPGRYTVRVEALAKASLEGDARQQALVLMSRAGQEGFAGTPEALGLAAASCREALAAWRA